MTQSTEELLRLDEAAQQWERETRAAFLEAYAEEIAAPAHGGIGAAPQGSTAADGALVSLFEIEKALYELRYELGNRVDWAQVPLQGLLALIGAAASPTPAPSAL